MKILSTIIAVFLAGGCATHGIQNRELELINDANYQFSKGKYDLARKRYQALLNSFPDSQFRLNALIGAADSYYMQKEYYLAEPAYQKFSELYPLSPETPRANFYLAMSYFHETLKVPQDHTNTKNADDAFRKFIAKHPDHPAVPTAEEKIRHLDDLLERKVLYIIEFYFRTDHFISTIRRVDEFMANHPFSRYVPRALLLKGESYMEEEAFKKAKKTFEDLVGIYGDSEAAKEARQKLIKLERMSGDS